MTAAYGGGAAEQVVTALLGVTSGLIANALYELLRNNVVGLSDRADLELTHEDALMILESELNRQFPDAFDDRPSVVDSIVAEHISGSRWSFELANSTHCFEVDVSHRDCRRHSKYPAEEDLAKAGAREEPTKMDRSCSSN